jgi:hypothetical protein
MVKQLHYYQQNVISIYRYIMVLHMILILDTHILKGW